RRGEHLESLQLIVVNTARYSGRVDLAAKTVEAGQHGAAVGEAAEVDAAERNVAAIDGVGLKPGVGHPQISRLSRRRPQDAPGVGVGWSQIDAWRHPGHARAQLSGKHRPQGR